VKGVAAVLDTYVEQVQRQQGHVGIPVVDVPHNRNGRFARRGPLLGVDEVGDLEIQG